MVSNSTLARGDTNVTRDHEPLVEHAIQDVDQIGGARYVGIRSITPLETRALDPDQKCPLLSLKPRWNDASTGA